MLLLIKPGCHALPYAFLVSHGQFFFQHAACYAPHPLLLHQPHTRQAPHLSTRSHCSLCTLRTCARRPRTR